MTCTPHIDAGRSGSHLKDPDGRGIGRLWLALCMLSVCSACYFGKIEVIDNDMPPIILTYNKTPMQTLPLESSEVRVFVLVSDENPDTLRYEWFLSESGSIDDAKRLPGGGTEVVLKTDESLDGQRLHLSIVDQMVQQTSTWWDLEVVR